MFKFADFTRRISPIFPNILITGLILIAVYVPNLIIHLHQQTPFHLSGLFMFLFALFGFILSLSGTVCFWSFMVLIFISEIINAHCLAYFGVPLNIEYLINLRYEHQDIFKIAYLSIVWYVLPTLLFFYGIIVLFYKRTKLYRWHGSYTLLCLMVCFKFYNDTSSLNAQHHFNPADTTLQNSLKVLTLLPYIAQTHPINWQPYSVTQKPNKSPVQNILVIMGESLTTSHLPMFGYHRNTLPHIQQLLTTNSQWQYAQGISGSVGTRGALTLFWTLTREPGNLANIRNAAGNLFELAHQAGFKNYYYSTQDGHILQDINAKHIDEIITNEKETVLFPSFSSQEQLKPQRDDELPLLLQRINFKNHKNFVVINLRVPHAIYEEHYAHRQAEFRKFLPDDPSEPREIYATNTYDNALLYMDDVINRLIENFVSQAGTQPYSIYITADHGQLFNFQGQWGHGQLLIETAKVPFFMHHSKTEQIPPIISHYQIGKLIADDLGFTVSNPNEKDNTYYVIENNLFFKTNFIKYRLNGSQLIELEQENTTNLQHNQH